MSTSYIGRARGMVTSLIGERGKLGKVVRPFSGRFESFNMFKAEAEVDGYKVFFTVIVYKEVTWKDEVWMFADSSRTHLITQWVPWSRRSRMTNKANLTKHMLKALL